MQDRLLGRPESWLGSLSGELAYEIVETFKSKPQFAELAEPIVSVRDSRQIIAEDGSVITVGLLDFDKCRLQVMRTSYGLTLAGTVDKSEQLSEMISLNWSTKVQPDSSMSMQWIRSIVNVERDGGSSFWEYHENDAGAIKNTQNFVARIREY